MISTIASCDILIPVSNETPKLLAWFEFCKKLPWYEANIEGLQRAKDYLKNTALASYIK